MGFSKVYFILLRRLLNKNDTDCFSTSMNIAMQKSDTINLGWSPSFNLQYVLSSCLSRHFVLHLFLSLFRHCTPHILIATYSVLSLRPLLPVTWQPHATHNSLAPSNSHIFSHPSFSFITQPIVYPLVLDSYPSSEVSNFTHYP